MSQCGLRYRAKGVEVLNGQLIRVGGLLRLDGGLHGAENAVRQF